MLNLLLIAGANDVLATLIWTRHIVLQAQFDLRAVKWLLLNKYSRILTSVN